MTNKLRIVGRAAVVACCLAGAGTLGLVPTDARSAWTWGTPGPDPQSCDALRSLTLENTTIAASQVVEAGRFAPPARGGRSDAALFGSLPSFCRVEAVLRPTRDSEIGVEVWLPVAGWNGKFQAVGNGGWAGAISYPALARAVARGYATASTDTGHNGDRAAFALGHPEKLDGFRVARRPRDDGARPRRSSTAFYGSAPKVSYWNGCSPGGRQGINEAQRFPADFDAIVAGAPANNWIHLHGSRMIVDSSGPPRRDSEDPGEKYPAMHKAVLEPATRWTGSRTA